VADLVKELQSFVHEICVFDPLADCDEAQKAYGIDLVSQLPSGPFDAAIIAVRHRAIRDLSAGHLRRLLVPGGVLYDLKQVLPIGDSDARL
jgi:UDP-N-acetyl-D-galactosamine dehydrogenase